MARKSSEFLIYIRDKLSLSGINTLQKKLGTLQDKMKAAFNARPVRMFKQAILGVTAAIAGSVVEGAKFNVSMARVWTMVGGGIENFKELRKEARALASEFGKSRAEIAGGMYNALSAGVDRSNLESFMRSAAKVAVADGSDVSVAVDGITTVLNAFNKKAGETDEVIDLLFQTVKQGKTTFGELAANLSNTASTAASAGIPLEQILAHISTLTAQGTPTAQATTQIRQSIIGLNKALGDGWSKTMTYQEALKAVWEQSGHSQTKLLKLVGSTEAMAAVLGGVGENAAMAADKLEGMEDAAGAAREAFERVNQFRHWPTLLETARGFVSKFGEEVDQRVRPFVVAVTEQIKEWTGDDSLWSSIKAFLDSSASRLSDIRNDIAATIKQIKSLDDLKVLAATVGEWLKEKLVEGGKQMVAYLAEKAPAIGSAIGQAVWDAVTNANQDKPDFSRKKELSDQAWKEGHRGPISHTRRTNELIEQETTSNRQARLEAEGQALAERVSGRATGATETFINRFEKNLLDDRNNRKEAPPSAPATAVPSGYMIQDGQMVPISGNEFSRLSAMTPGPAMQTNPGWSIIQGAQQTPLGPEQFSNFSQPSAAQSSGGFEISGGEINRISGEEFEKKLEELQQEFDEVMKQGQEGVDTLKGTATQALDEAKTASQETDAKIGELKNEVSDSMERFQDAVNAASTDTGKAQDKAVAATNKSLKAITESSKATEESMKKIEENANETLDLFVKNIEVQSAMSARISNINDSLNRLWAIVTAG